MNDEVVITGAGVVTSLGNSLETWDALISGKSGIHAIEDFNAQGFACCSAAQVHDLGPEQLYIHPRDSRIMDKHAYMLLKAARDAFTQANLVAAPLPPEDIGFFAAMGMVDYNIEDLLPSVLNSLDEQGGLDYDKFFSKAYQEIHPLWPLSMLNNINFCQVAIDLGIKGENTTFCPHSDSAFHSIIESYNAVLEKKAEVVLAGGVSEKVSPLSIARASLSGILNNEDTYCRPFGKDRKGIILGEGSGIISIELRESAEKRKLTCLSKITGYGSSFDLCSSSNCPGPKGISLSMEAALAKSGLKPADIDLLIAHGDGTYEGDKNEAEAIHNTFAVCINKLNVYSSKAALGHLLSGAAAVDLIIGIYILKNGIIPPVPGPAAFENSFKFKVVSSGPLKSNVRRIMINSQSSEGQCASLIIEAVQ